MHSVDFLIIGQGLAGSLLAYSLIKRGSTVLVVDHAHHGSSTQVAAGLINPITGHRLSMDEHFFDYANTAKKLYWQIERDLGCKFYSELPQTRLIQNAKQDDYLSKRKRQNGYTAILDDVDNTAGWFSDSDQFPYGAVNLSQTAVVDTKQLLHFMREWLTERESLQTSNLNYEEIKAIKSGVEYCAKNQKINASKIIFCEGYQAINNPWLSELPFKLAKGEILTIKPQQQVDRMLNWGNWLVPGTAASGNARLGSNYIWHDTELTTSPKTADTFLGSLQEFTEIKAELIEHEIGIRPSTSQRKPFVGPLTNLANAYCLNGLGSKGCLIAPHYTAMLCDHLLHSQALPKELTQWL